MTVDELLHRISSLELSEWMAYERVEGPLSLHQRIDRGAAQVASMVAEPNRNAKVKPKPFNIGDFLPNWLNLYKKAKAKAEKQQSPEEQMGILKRINQHHRR